MSKRRTVAMLVVAVCTIISGISGWVLLIAALCGNRWALVGWVWGISTSVTSLAFLNGIGKEEPTAIQKQDRA